LTRKKVPSFFRAATASKQAAPLFRVPSTVGPYSSPHFGDRRVPMGLQGWPSSRLGACGTNLIPGPMGTYFPVCRLRLRITVSMQRAVEALAGFSFGSAVAVPLPSSWPPISLPALSSWGGHGGGWLQRGAIPVRWVADCLADATLPCQYASVPSTLGRCSTRVISFGFQVWGIIHGFLKSFSFG
jgi:hypothetical protein